MKNKTVKNSDFFKSNIETDEAEKSLNNEFKNREELLINDNTFVMSENITKVKEVFRQYGFNSLEKSADKLIFNISKDRFSVAVVGEFSRGKSTFINRLIEKANLPTGNLPTTAVTTRVRYSPKNSIFVFDKHGKKEQLPICEETWERIGTGDDFTETYNNVVVGVDDDWLHKNNIEIIDTPGAGDLEEKRAKTIGNALQSCHAAIITIRADSVLSITEKLFIEQRLIAKNTPFLLLIVTRLDTISPEERARVIEYIKSSLKNMKVDIPVYIPYEIDMQTDIYNDVMGLDNIRKKIVEWSKSKELITLKERYINEGIEKLIHLAINSINEQISICDADEEKRKEMIEEKESLLEKTKIDWEFLNKDMLDRRDKCYQKLLDKAGECSDSTIERLKYELSHSNSPERWWNEDYPYRCKIELANIAGALEREASKNVSNDLVWLNSQLEKNYKTHIYVEKSDIVDKHAFSDNVSADELAFENLEKKRNLIRIGSTALSVAGFVAFASVGMIPIAATMGISTGTAILNEKYFKGKVEQQKNEVRKAIDINIPKMIDEAMLDSRNNISRIYENIISEFWEQYTIWENVQKKAIQSSIKPIDSSHKIKLEESKATLEQFLNN